MHIELKYFPHKSCFLSYRNEYVTLPQPYNVAATRLMT